MKTFYTSYQIEAEVLNALAHPSRLQILDLLRDGEACVCHIQAMLGQRQAYISQQLNVLRHAGVVASRKDGLRAYYQVSDPKIFEVVDSLKAFLRETGTWQANPAGEDLRQQPCNCPQCSEKHAQTELEAHHA